MKQVGPHELHSYTVDELNLMIALSLKLSFLKQV